MTYYLLLTAFTVSIDSFVCGFSLAFRKGSKIPIIIGIALTVLAMCLIANYTAVFLTKYLSEKTASLGGLILIGVGLYNLLKKDEPEKKNNKGIIKQSIISGFAVGLDGALANLSLALMGINAFYVPLTIAVMHAFTISLGVLLSKTSIAQKMGKISFLPPLVLILLGAYKLTALFL